MELGWLLDDAIDSLKGRDGPILPSSRKMQQISTLETAIAGDIIVSMRTNMESLDCLWQQRVRERCQSFLEQTLCARSQRDRLSLPSGA